MFLMSEKYLEGSKNSRKILRYDLAPNELKNIFRTFENIFKYLKEIYFEFRKIEKNQKKYEILPKTSTLHINGLLARLPLLIL
jgi:hypothetical protein